MDNAENKANLTEAIDCVEAWDADARILGNLRAGDLASLLHELKDYRSREARILARALKEAAGYQQLAKTAMETKEPGLLVLLIQHDGSEFRVFGPDQAAEKRFAESNARGKSCD